MSASDTPAPKPRPGILDIAPYVGGKSDIAGVDQVIKLSSNEGALGPSPRAVKAHQDISSDLHRYPDGGSADLRQALGAQYALNPDYIIPGAGSDELISLLVRAYAGPGDEVLYSQHGFLMYPIAAKSVGATPVCAPEDGLTASVDSLLASVTDATRLCFIANPNNPTGTWLARSEIRRLRDGLPDSVLLVLDGAYAEFMTDPDYEAGIELVNRSNNTVMTRTFSKIYGLGGLRLGWGYFPPAIADVINRLRNPFNVSLSAQAAGIAALNDHAFTERVRRHTAKTRQWFAAQVSRLPDTVVHPSVCNFVLVEFPADQSGKRADDANNYLMAGGVIPRKVAGYGLPDCLRITIGTQAEMTRCFELIRDFLHQE